MVRKAREAEVAAEARVQQLKQQLTEAQTTAAAAPPPAAAASSPAAPSAELRETRLQLQQVVDRLQQQQTHLLLLLRADHLRLRAVHLPERAHRHRRQHPHRRCKRERHSAGLEEC